MSLKEAFLKIEGREIAAQYYSNEKTVRLGKGYIQRWLAGKGFDEKDLQSFLSQFTEFMRLSEVFTTLEACYGRTREYKRITSWLRDTVKPEIIRQMESVPDGARLRIINGLVVREHPTKKGLFSLTDAWKAAECYFEKESSWRAKRPAIWQQDNKVGINNLIHQIGKGQSVLTFSSSPIAKIKGRTGGTYAHPRLLVAYTEFVHPELHHRVLRVFDRREKQRDIKRRAKGTEIREKGVQTHVEFRGECKIRRSSWIPANGELQGGLWDMSAKEKMELENIPQPFRDNLSFEDHILLSMSELTARLGMMKTNAYGQREVNKVCRQSGSLIRDFHKKDLEKTFGPQRLTS